MMYSLMTLPDSTDIVYSEVRKDEQGHDYVKVYLERWNDKRGKFDSIDIILPSGNISSEGFSREEKKFFIEGIKRLSGTIWELAEEKNAEFRTGTRV